jgi:DNA polymerase-2
MSDPANVLNHINQLIEKIDPDLIQTKWGDDWLFPELLEMESAAGIPLKMNRDEERKLFWKKEITYYSYGQIVFRGREAHLFGRCHIDTKNAVMWSDYHLDGALESARVTTLPIEQAARVSPGPAFPPCK